MQFSDIIGTIPGWITASGVTGIFAIVVWWQLGLRKLRIEAENVKISAVKVEHEEGADIRDHYAEELAAMRRIVDEKDERYDRAREQFERRIEECQRDREKLRDDARTLKDIVAGLIRIITQASASQAILLTPAASAEVRAAAQRVQLLFAPIDSEETRRGDKPR